MTFVIAEAGVNHGGKLAAAFKLCDAAKAAGADAVKFQHFNSRALWGDDRIYNLELSDADMQVIAKHCTYIGIEFMCTPFGVREVGVIAPLVKRIKVASGCLERWDLLAAVRDTRLPVIMSTGMANEGRIDMALTALGYYKETSVTLLQCTSAYPCRVEDANLRAMDTLAQVFGAEVGFSDHTRGITVAIAAAARGATVIEKHLTLDCSAEGPDHKASIEPAEFRVMVSAIRTVEAALGDGVKRAQPAERETMEAWYGDKR